jgi:hypothetical protein
MACAAAFFYASVKVEQWFAVQVSDTTMMIEKRMLASKKINYFMKSNSHLFCTS